MSIDRVLEMYNTIWFTDEILITFISGLLWLMIGISLFVHIVKDFRTISKTGVAMRLILSILILILGSYQGYRIIQKDYLSEEQWQSEYLQPYLSRQPDVKREVHSYKVLQEEASSETKSIHLTSKKKPATVKIKYVNENQITTEIITKAYIQKTKQKQKYFTYKTIEKDISEQYPKNAYYETVLYVPKNDH